MKLRNERAWFHPAMKMRPARHIKSPWSGHIPFGAWIVAVTKPAVVVELGTHFGNSYFTFCQSVVESNLSTRLFAIDTWVGDKHALHYGESVFESVSERNKMFSKFSTLLRMTFDEALDQFQDGSVDLIHIDGLHTYEAVKHDFETWLPKMSPRGIVLFHDTVEVRGDFGVWKFWAELKTKYPSIEFPYSHGLGVLFLSEPVDAEVKALLADPHRAIAAFRRQAELSGLIVPQRLDRRTWHKIKSVGHLLGAKSSIRGVSADISRIVRKEGYSGLMRRIRQIGES